MSELPGGEWAKPPDEPDDMLEIARQAVFYRDLDTSSATFNMLAALELIQHSLATGEPLDHVRLARLREGFGGDDYGFPDTDTYYDEDGYEVTTDKAGNVLSRVESSPSTMRYFRDAKERRLTTEAYVAATTPRYVEQLLAQIADPATTQGVLRRDGELVSQNELELAALGAARDTLRGHGLTVEESHARVGADGAAEHPKSELTHTLHTLTVTRN